jgi:hypothetical protein
MRRGIGGLLTDDHAGYYHSSTVLVKEYLEMIGSKGDRATGNGNVKLEISVEPLCIVNMTLHSTMICGWHLGFLECFKQVRRLIRVVSNPAMSPALLRALLRKRARAILLNFAEVVDAFRENRPATRGSGVRWEFRWRRRRYCAGIRSKTFRGDAVEVHRSVPRRADGGDHGRPASAECFLHGGSEWRRLEDQRFWQHVESHL